MLFRVMTFVALAAMTLTVTPTMSRADDPAGTSMSIAIVDVEQLMTKSKAAKSIQSQGKDLRAKYQKKITSIEDDLKDARADVMKASQGGDKEKFIKERESFQKELGESQKKLAEYNAKLDQAVGDALGKLRDEIMDIVEDMAKDRSYDLVMSRADVIVVSKNYDITKEVMDRLNDEVRKISVKD